jgi:hypothetical protein
VQTFSVLASQISRLILGKRISPRAAREFFLVLASPLVCCLGSDLILTRGRLRSSLHACNGLQRHNPATIENPDSR